jgi:CHAD domain-containing protein
MVNPGSIFEELHGELAISLIACRADPDRRAVHSLRTSTRRLEALLRAVQQEHPHSTSLQRTIKEALRPLKSLRRAAGPVRDMDVQRGLVATIAESLERTETEAEHRKLKADCDDLDHRLRRRRKRLAKDLASTAKEFELTLEAALEPVKGTLEKLGGTLLLEAAKEITEQSSKHLKEITHGSLHRYRKQSKAARYLGEMEKTSGPAKRLAKRLKSVLDSIGRWHDWMLLAQELKAAIGKGSLLTKAIKRERNRTWVLAVRSVQRLQERPLRLR